MPTYLYTCKNHHVTEFSHAPGEVINSNCSTCGEPLRRKFTAPNIKRSCFIEPSPAIKRHLDTVDERRDRFEEKYANRKEAP
jgi:hypothetical protein